MAPAVFYTSHDVADCFYQFRIPLEISRFFGLHPVRASDVGVDSVFGHMVPSDTTIVPHLSVLPMGVSFALHWAQMGHESILTRAGVCGVDSFLVDFAPSADLSSEVGTIVYVDNGVFTNIKSSLPQSAQRRATDAFAVAGSLYMKWSVKQIT